MMFTNKAPKRRKTKERKGIVEIGLGSYHMNIILSMEDFECV